MGIGGSIFTIALGAILRFAVRAHARGLSVNTAGTILMVVGGIALLISLYFARPRRETVVRDADGEIVQERRVYEQRPPL
jgi:hypothetical protein